MHDPGFALAVVNPRNLPPYGSMAIPMCCRAKGPRLAHRATVLLVVSALYAATTAGASALARHLLWNRTDSLPHGLYWVTAGIRSALRPGDLIAFTVPEDVQRLIYARGYLRPGDVLLKPVVATSGEHVCTERDVLRIGAAVFGPVLARDSAGRPLPRYAVCGPVPAGHVLVASPSPHSFDSRAFGPISVRDVRGKVYPLWTY